MAGGLFERPFVLNEKCIIFSLILIALFLINPGKLYKNFYLLAFVLFLLFVLGYVAMAWYDYFYDCRLLPLKKGGVSFTGLFKPEVTNKKKQLEHHETNEEKRKNKFVIYLFHLILIVPLLVYLSYYRNKSHLIGYILLGVLAVFTAIYHGGALMTVSH